MFIADIVGTPGRKAVEERLPSLLEELEVDFCVANGENVADGVGITPKLADRLLATGIDAITLGNHVWRRVEIVPYLTGSDRVVRPANLGKAAPGKGLAVVTARDGTRVAVLNVMGSLFLDVPVSMWEIVDDLVAEALRQAQVLFVDVHAEATSEKVALARWLDGKATAVIGTHTHVQTNDARVLPGGTAALSDAGMTGPHADDVRIEGALIECGTDGRATSCTTIRVPV